MGRGRELGQVSVPGLEVDDLCQPSVCLEGLALLLQELSVSWGHQVASLTPSSQVDHTFSFSEFSCGQIVLTPIAR